ncbi:MAG TPA: toprim domain-containing protein [Pirellulales bacterium]|nr:toprim domain-containing protein [Pirellulales bacterium]
MIATSPGALLAERLGIESLGRDGHNVKAACIACDSSDAFRVHQDSGIAFCHSCNGKWSHLELAKQILGDVQSAWSLLIELGLEQPRHNGNGHHHNGNGKPIDPIEAIARAKHVSPDALRAFGATVADGKVTLPAYGPDGQQCSTFTLTADKGLFGKGQKAGLFFPHVDGAVRLPAPGETWHVVEGPKDAAALHELGLLAAGLNTCALAPRFTRLFAGVDVILIPDRDTAGVEGAEKSCRALFGKAPSQRIAHLPSEVKVKSGDDVRDILRRENGAELVKQAIADAAQWKPPTDANGSLPDIIVGVDEARVNDEAIASLAARPEVFQRGNALVHVTTETKLPKGVRRPPAVPRIAEIPSSRLRELMAQAARYFSIGAKDEINPVHPPAWCVSGVAARGAWEGIRCLELVTETPVLRPDGTVLQEAGYDADTAILYRPNAKYPAVDAEPSQQDAHFAAQELFEVVDDFPFEAEAHRSAWLAAVVTPFARPAFEGPAPLMLADANIRGAGKGLLIDAIGIIASGRGMARMAAAEDDAAWRKAITSIAVAGDPLILVDNIAGALGSAALDAALTATVWTDRLLGENKLVTCPLNAIWYGTGNNVILKADTARRTLHIRLDSSEEKPEERQGFKHADLLAWVKQERPRLAVAALTILRAYCFAGRPKQAIKPWGSFEGWSDLIRGAIVWAGYPDPGETRQALADSADTEATALRALIAGWEEIDTDGTGCRVADVLESLKDKSNEHRFSTLRGALADTFGSKPGDLPSSKQVSGKFHRMRRRLIGGKCLDRRLDSSKTAHWFVSKAK